MQDEGDPTCFREIEKRGWDGLAGNYDSFTGSFSALAVDPLLRAVALRADMRLLDIACGPGYGAAAASRRGARAIGIDFAPGMVAKAARDWPNAEFREGDAESLLFPDASFDAAICGFGLLHMADPDRAIAEAFRVLRHGGRFAFTVWCPPDRTEFFAIVLDAVREHGRMDVPMPPAPPMFRFSDAAETRRALAAVGFAAPEIEEIPLVWHPATPQAFLDYCYKSSVRMPMLLGPQTPTARDAIHRAILDKAARFVRNGRLELAWPALLAVALKP